MKKGYCLLFISVILLFISGCNDGEMNNTNGKSTDTGNTKKMEVAYEAIDDTSDIDLTIPSIDKNAKTHRVVRVVDGDTIIISYHYKSEERIRLIGIDTPELDDPSDNSGNLTDGEIAAAYTQGSLLGKSVALELDVQERDQYGRLLAYVYVDGKMLNAKLLEEGYAVVATYPPNVKYVDVFTDIQNKAMNENRGFWYNRNQ